jgi:hypothetical protein
MLAAPMSSSSRAVMSPGLRLAPIDGWFAANRLLRNSTTSEAVRAFWLAIASWLCAMCSWWRASSAARTETTTAAPRPAITSAVAVTPRRYRLAKRQLRSRRLSRRALTGSPARWRRRSSAKARALTKRRSGSRCSAVMAIASRSPRSWRARWRTVDRSARCRASPVRIASLGTDRGAVSTASSIAARVGRSGRYGSRPVSSSYSSTPSVKTSDCGPMMPPATCSGEAYVGVSAASPNCVCRFSMSVSCSSLAVPKSSRWAWPSSETSTLEGFRSRCTTRRSWANCTASSTWRNSFSREGTSSALCSQ